MRSRKLKRIEKKQMIRRRTRRATVMKESKKTPVTERKPAVP